jgi:hypothetical protein
VRLDIVERMNGMPAAAAARAVAGSPSGCTRPWVAVGAIATGSEIGTPRSVVAVVTSATSTRTRGRSVRRRHAASFSATESSSHEPPAM